MDPNELHQTIFDALRAACTDGQLEWSTLAEWEELWQISQQKIPLLETKVKDLEEALLKSLEPPLSYAVFLRQSPGDERDVVVGAGSSRIEARLSAGIEDRRDDLTPGQELVLNKEQNVVALRGQYQGGETAEVVNILKPDYAAEVLEVLGGTAQDPQTLRVRWREGEELEVTCADELSAHPVKRSHIVAIDPDTRQATHRVRPRLHVRAGGHEGVVVEISDLLFDQGVQIGDIVRVETGLRFAFEKLPAYETGGLALEDIPDVSYEDIGGLENQLEQVYDAIELPYLFRAQFEEYQLNRPKGILLYGPPGCGKTMIAKAVANSLTSTIRQHLTTIEKRIVTYNQLRQNPDDGQVMADFVDLLPSDAGDVAFSSDEALAYLAQSLAHHHVDLDHLERELSTIRTVLNTKDGIRGFFLNVKGPELLDKYVGETEHRIRKIFEEARRHATFYTPVVIFFDEMESMFRARGSGRSSDVETTIVPQFLAELDGVEASENLIIIGASNRSDLIDPAIMRPGRLDIKIKVDRPTREAATDIFALYLLPTLPLDEAELELGHADGVGKIVFGTAYRPDDGALARNGQDPLARFGPLCPMVDCLPPACDFRLAYALASTGLDQLAAFPPKMPVREAFTRLGEHDNLISLIRRLKHDTPLDQIVTPLAALAQHVDATGTLADLVAAQVRREWVAEAIILEIIQVLYSPASLMNALTSSGNRYTFYLKDFMSGAVIANIVARAKKTAVKRVVLEHESRSQGIGLADLQQAVYHEFNDSKDQLVQNKLTGELGLNEQLKFVELVLQTGHIDPWNEPKLRPYETFA
jgi:SpoVK/Ycf46/Vps4 family AAA+-type ATPase